MTVDTILTFFKEIPIPDYVITFLSIGCFVWFLFIWIEKIYKSYLWIILWLFIFSTVNLTLNSLNKNDVWINNLRDFFFDHKQAIGFYSILFIPFLAILLPFNKNIAFRVSNNKHLNYVVIILFWLFFFSFIFSIFLSIINNKFLFLMDNTLVQQVRESYFIKGIYSFFESSHIFSFLTHYDYVINLTIILFIFYKMTIGGIVDFLMAKLFRILMQFFEEKMKTAPIEESKE